jgi:hypothetical protein
MIGWFGADCAKGGPKFCSLHIRKAVGTNPHHAIP